MSILQFLVFDEFLQVISPWEREHLLNRYLNYRDLPIPPARVIELDAGLALVQSFRGIVVDRLTRALARDVDVVFGSDLIWASPEKDRGRWTMEQLVAFADAGGDVYQRLMDHLPVMLCAWDKQGRVIYSNIRKFVYYLLSCNMAEIATIFLAIAANSCNICSEYVLPVGLFG